jgi:hypothetical protein
VVYRSRQQEPWQNSNTPGRGNPSDAKSTNERDTSAKSEDRAAPPPPPKSTTSSPFHKGEHDSTPSTFAPHAQHATTAESTGDEQNNENRPKPESFSSSGHPVQGKQHGSPQTKVKGISSFTTTHSQSPSAATPTTPIVTPSSKPQWLHATPCSAHYDAAR